MRFCKVDLFDFPGLKNQIESTKSFGSLAQLVEQRTFNPLVAGSNPARPTKIAVI
jgi:hypothetical protein